MSTSTIYDLLSRQAAVRPDAAALRAPSQSPLSWGQLHAHVAAGAATLQSMGVEQGDRVAIVLPNGPELAAAFLTVASWTSAAPLDPEYGREEFEFCLSDLDAKALVVEAGVDSPAVRVAQEQGIPIIRLHRLPDAEAGLYVQVGEQERARAGTDSPEPTDEALVLHSAGPASRPEQVSLTQRDLCTAAENVQKTLRLRPEDRCLNVMPLFHVHALRGAVLSSLASGASVICAPGFYAPYFFQWMDACEPTWYTAAPSVHQSILDRAAAARHVIQRRPLRLIHSASAPLPPRIRYRLEDTFEAPVIESYGMTEAAPQLASTPLPSTEGPPGSVRMPAGPEGAILEEAEHS